MTDEVPELYIERNFLNEYTDTWDMSIYLCKVLKIIITNIYTITVITTYTIN